MAAADRQTSRHRDRRTDGGQPGNSSLLQVRSVVDPMEHYGGELTGVRSHLTKSIKIH